MINEELTKMISRYCTCTFGHTSEITKMKYEPAIRMKINCIWLLVIVQKNHVIWKISQALKLLNTIIAQKGVKIRYNREISFIKKFYENHKNTNIQWIFELNKIGQYPYKNNHQFYFRKNLIQYKNHLRWFAFFLRLYFSKLDYE